MSLKEISAKHIYDNLSRDAQEQLIGHLYVAHLGNIADLLYEIDEWPNFDKIVSDFMEEFPELFEDATETITTPYSIIREDSNKPFSKIIGIQIGKKRIYNDIPFEVNRNNALIDFFVQRDAPIFAGIRNVIRLKDS